MAFWERDREAKDASKISVWDQALLISAETAVHPEILTPGWYFYKQDYLWHGLKPNSTGTGLQKGYDFQSLREVQQWLEVPVPQELLREEENRETLGQQLAKLRETPQAPSEQTESIPSPKADSIRKRDMDVHIRMTPQEYARFQELVEQSGMTKTSYLIRCALKSQGADPCRQSEAMEELQNLIRVLQGLLTETGQQSGLLKQAVRSSSPQNGFQPHEVDSLIKATKDQTKLQKKIMKTMEAVNGYFKTHLL